MQGTGFIKVGFAGDDKPTKVFPSCVGRPKHFRLMGSESNVGAINIGDAVSHTADSTHPPHIPSRVAALSPPPPQEVGAFFFFCRSTRPGISARRHHCVPVAACMTVLRGAVASVADRSAV